MNISIFKRAAMMLVTMLTTVGAWAGNTDPYVQIVSGPTYTSSGTSVTLRIWFWNYDGDNARFIGNTYLTIDGTNTVNLAGMWSTFKTSNEDNVKGESGTGQWGDTGAITLNSTNVGTAKLKNLQKDQTAASDQSYGDGAQNKFNTIDLELSFNSSFSFYGHALGIKGTWQDKCDDENKSNAEKHVTVDIPGYPRCKSVTATKNETDPLKIDLSWTTETYSSSADTNGNWIVYRGTEQVASVAYGTTSYTDNIQAYTGSQTITYTVTFCPTGWSVSNTSPTGLYSSKSITLTANTYTVHFDANGGTGTVADQAFTYGVAQTLTANAFTRTGYTFAGWNTKVDGSGDSYADGAEVNNLTTTNIGTVNLFAKWTPITYNITYNLNGGTNAEGNPATYTIQSTAITLSAPTRTGYTFAGWTGTGLDAATTSVTIASGSTGDREYTATWTPITYDITYNLNGGTNAEGNSATYTIESSDIKLSAPTRTGYTFAGWTGTDLSEATTSVTIASGSTGDREYTATWTINNYTISYNLNGGTVATENPATYTIESDAITLVNPTRTGYTFAGWTVTDLSEATTSVTIASGSTGDREYTANWTPISYNIRFDDNGGTGTVPDAMNFTYGEAQNLPSDTFTKGYFTSVGWNTAADGSGNSYTLGQSVQNLTATAGANITLYAQWPTVTGTWTSGDCTAKLYSDGTMIISGTGAMTDYTSASEQPWNSSASAITSVVIE